MRCPNHARTSRSSHSSSSDRRLLSRRSEKPLANLAERDDAQIQCITVHLCRWSPANQSRAAPGRVRVSSDGMLVSRRKPLIERQDGLSTDSGRTPVQDPSGARTVPRGPSCRRAALRRLLHDSAPLEPRSRTPPAKAHELQLEPTVSRHPASCYCRQCLFTSWPPSADPTSRRPT
jgi:hypothetical protein